MLIFRDQVDSRSAASPLLNQCAAKDDAQAVMNGDEGEVSQAHASLSLSFSSYSCAYSLNDDDDSMIPNSPPVLL